MKHIVFSFPPVKEAALSASDENKSQTINSAKNSVPLFSKILSGRQPRNSLGQDLLNSVAVKTSKLILFRYLTNFNMATIRNFDVCNVFSGYRG